MSGQPATEPIVPNGRGFAGEVVDGRFRWPVDVRAYRVPAERLYVGFDPPFPDVPSEVDDDLSNLSHPDPYSVAVIALRGTAATWVMVQINALTNAEIAAGTFDPMTMPGDNVRVGPYAAAIRSNRATFGPIQNYKVRIVGRLGRRVIEALISSFQLDDGIASVELPVELVDSDPFAYASSLDAEEGFPGLTPIDRTQVTFSYGDAFIWLTVEPDRPIDLVTELAMFSDKAETVKVGVADGVAISPGVGAQLVRWKSNGLVLEVQGRYKGFTRAVALALAESVRRFTPEEWAALKASVPAG